MKHNVFSRFLFVIIAWMTLDIVGLIPQSALAQDSIPPEPQLIMDGIRPTNLGWADQENILAFSDASLPSGQVINEFDTWHQFDLDSGQITQSYIWPLQPAVPSQIEDQIVPSTLLIRSPTGRYYIFVAPNNGPETWFKNELKVYDTVQNIVINTGVPAGGVTDRVGTLDIIWSTDTKFIISTLPEEGGIPTLPNLYYATIHSSSITIKPMLEVGSQGQTFIIYDVIDFASDGENILIQGGIREEFKSFFGIWNLRTPSELIVVPETEVNRRELRGAQFTSTNATEFVFVDDQRLGRYDVINGTSSTISTSVNGQNYRFAEFSNNGDMLALADDEAVYWLDLRPAQVTPTPILNAHLQPTSVCSPTRIATDDIVPSNLQWLDEGLQLTFFDAASLGSYVRLEIDEESWYKFDVDHQTLSRSNKWLAQPEIPDDLLNDIYSNSLAFLTPDGQYLIYASKPHPDIGENEILIKIYDIQTGLILDTGIPSGPGSILTGFTRLIWGGNDRFVLSTTPNNVGVPTPPILYYIDLSTEPISVKLIIGLDLGGYQPFYVVDVFDVSADGMHLLLKGGFIGEGITYLAIWDVQSPNELTYIPEHQVMAVKSVLAAQFTTFDGTEFLFFNDQGLGRYDVLNATSEIINRDVTADEYRFAEFSNNGEMLALADDEAVYWLDLRPAQVTPDLCP